MFPKIRTSCIVILACASGSAIAAGPLANTVHGLVGVVTGALNAPAGGATSAAGVGGVAPNALALPAAKGLPKLKLSSAALPGLAPTATRSKAARNGNGNSDGPVGITLFNDGPDAVTGYDRVLSIAGMDVITAADRANQQGPLDLADVRNGLDPLASALGGGKDNPLLTPYLVGRDGNGGNLDLALFDGNRTANAGATGAGIALFSGDFTGNGAVGVGVGNGDFTGNGTRVGIAALSDNRGGKSGNGGSLGVSALNQGDLLTICGAGNCFGGKTIAARASSFPAIPSNPLINFAFFGKNNTGNVDKGKTALISGAIGSGSNTGNGGVIAIGVDNGAKTGQGKLVGVGALSGDFAGSGPVAVGIKNGRNSGQTSAGMAGQGIAAVAALSGDKSARRQGTAKANAPRISVDAVNRGLSGDDPQASLPVHLISDQGTSSHGGAGLPGLGALPVPAALPLQQNGG